MLAPHVNIDSTMLLELDSTIWMLSPNIGELSENETPTLSFVNKQGLLVTTVSTVVALPVIASKEETAISSFIAGLSRKGGKDRQKCKLYFSYPIRGSSFCKLVPNKSSRSITESDCLIASDKFESWLMSNNDFLLFAFWINYRFVNTSTLRAVLQWCAVVK